MTQRSFNPTLVRLRQGQHTVKTSKGRMFQSHAGSIEALDANCDIWNLDARFNPTLVRLRPRIKVVVAVTVSMFQSHAGSIEAMMYRTVRPAITIVSIPRWFD